MSNQKIDSNQVSFSTGGAGSLEVKEVDGVPDVVDVSLIVVSNGTLTDDGGGQVTITTGGGGGTPASPDKSVQYNNAGSFGAVTVNATATAEYLKQVSGGTPAFAQVAYSEVSGTPTIPSAAGTVTAETSYGNASNAGAAATFSKGDHTHGTPSLSMNSPVAVAGTATAGSGTAPSKDDHAHVGVHSVAKSGSSALVGDVTLSQGTNVTLTQSGNDISIAASASGGGADFLVVQVFS